MVLYVSATWCMREVMSKRCHWPPTVRALPEEHAVGDAWDLDTDLAMVIRRHAVVGFGVIDVIQSDRSDHLGG